MKGAKRWFVWLGGCALALVLLVPLLRALDIDPLVWVANRIGNAMDAREQARRHTHQREVRERAAEEMEDAARGVPYRIDWPYQRPLSRKPFGFQIAVQGDEVEFYQEIPGTLPPPDVWFIYLTITYHDPEDQNAAVDTSSRLRIDETNVEPFLIERREHAYQDELVLMSVKRFNGDYAQFTCIHASSVKEFRAATTVEQLAKIDDESGCRTFLSIRPGVRLMVKFPIQRADVAHRAVTQALGLIDRSILEQPTPPPEK